MAIIQTSWRMSYAEMVDYVASQSDLAGQLGFNQRDQQGQLRTISQGQDWERRAALGYLILWRHDGSRFRL